MAVAEAPCLWDAGPISNKVISGAKSKPTAPLRRERRPRRHRGVAPTLAGDSAEHALRDAGKRTKIVRQPLRNRARYGFPPGRDRESMKIRCSSMAVFLLG
jgi:hypothetical protein